MTAAVVLAVGIAGAVSAFGAMSRASGVAAEYEQAALLAQRHLVEQEATADVEPTAASGDFGEDYPGYQWEQEIISTEFEGLVQLRLQVRWQIGGVRRSITVSTYMQQEQQEQ